MFLRPTLRKFFFLTSSLLIFILSIFYYFGFGFFTEPRIKKVRISSELPDSHNDLVHFLIETNGCKIRIKSTLSKFPENVSYTDCSDVQNLATLSDDEQVLSINDDFSDSECFVSEISNSDENNTAVTFSEAERFQDDLDITDKEFILTRCGSHYNLDANFLLKHQVEKKMSFWKKRKDLPTNVLVLYFENFSRNYFHNHLPKTMKLLKDMNFLDFPGYHSLDPSSNQNFLASLTGMHGSAIRSKCAPNQHTLDDCPFIWKYYNENKFVTIFSSDYGTGSEEYFRRNPTDYYPYAFFHSKNSLKKENPSLKVNDFCLGQHQPQGLLFDYTQRFLNKFENIPFFALMLNGIQIDHPDALANMDNDLTLLLENLNASQTLERTLVIILGSKAKNRLKEKTSLQMDGLGLGTDVFLPTLFIRAPELLFAKYPDEDMKNSLKLNTKRLITAKDINHTLKHLLVLNQMTFMENVTVEADGFSIPGTVSIYSFLPSLRERSSLFVPINDERTCADVHVGKNYCACADLALNNA